MSSEIMTIRQLAAYLQMSPTTIYHLVNKGELPGRKIGGQWRFIKTEIDNWIAGSRSSFPLDILVVEDEEPVCELFVKSLVPRGHRVVTARSGEDALRLLQFKPFDLVFLDLLLPGASGIEIHQELSQLPRPPEVIVITSFTSSHLLVKALELGLLSVIKKPFRIETILRAVEKVAHARASAIKSAEK